MTEEEEKKLARLEKRLVANVDFDDQALNILGRHRYLLHVGTPRMSAILQRGAGKHTQGIFLGNSHNHGIYP
jgi:hypothetical protein